MLRLCADRVVSAFKQGSSWPVLVSAGGRRLVVKLRGTAQGTAPLVAEVVVGELCDALGIATPHRYLVDIAAAIPSEDPHEELLELLVRSRGLNLGLQLLEGFRDLKPPDAARVQPEIAARIVWLDALVQNPDRTAQNPNLMIKAGQVWAIDHGAALTFQYDWSGVTEQSPRERGNLVAEHLFRVSVRELQTCDAVLAPLLSRDVLEAALAAVPSEFLAPLAPADSDLDRLRAAYVAFLWKRLREPRPFVGSGGRAPFEF